MGFDILEIPVWDEPFDIDKVADELRKNEVEASVAAFQTARSGHDRSRPIGQEPGSSAPEVLR